LPNIFHFLFLFFIFYFIHIACRGCTFGKIWREIDALLRIFQSTLKPNFIYLFLFLHEKKIHARLMQLCAGSKTL